MPTSRGDFAITVIEDKVVCAGGLGYTSLTLLLSFVILYIVFSSN